MFLLAWAAALAGFCGTIRHPAIVYWLSVLAGTLWLCVLSLRIIRREEGNLRWATLQQRLWLKANHPLEMEGQPRPSVLRMLPSLLFMAACVLLGTLVSAAVLVVSISIPLGVLWPPHTNVLELASPEHGQWWWVAGVMVAWALGALLGEELFFRGVLLPRMTGKTERRVRLKNALLYAAYGLHRPWMIPFRFLEGLAIAGPARRFRNNWLALAVRSVEGIGLLTLLLVYGSIFSPLPPLQGTLTSPHTARNPAPWNWPGGRLERPPKYDPNSGAMGQMDLRSCDLSALDLRSSREDLLFASFDARTHWPPSDRMPEGFDANHILELGKNPGLGLRRLHAQGITGRGVGIAIIDKPLQTTHREYAERLRCYEEIGGAGTTALMHGAAVASIAVGKTVGVAPGADLYYFAEPDALQASTMQFHLLAQGIWRVLDLNRHLPSERRIRVISLSISWNPTSPGYHDICAAAAAARRAGLLVISSSVEEVHGFHFNGLGRPPLTDPDEFASYEPGLWWSQAFWASPDKPLKRPRFLRDWRARRLAKLFQDLGLKQRLLIPMDSRTTASPTGENDYVFYREGGWSWSIPYIAGLYALAVQVDPQITPDRFWSRALDTGRDIQMERDGKSRTLGRVADPEALIAAVRQPNSIDAPAR